MQPLIPYLVDILWSAMRVIQWIIIGFHSKFDLEQTFEVEPTFTIGGILAGILKDAVSKGVCMQSCFCQVGSCVLCEAELHSGYRQNRFARFAGYSANIRMTRMKFCFARAIPVPIFFSSAKGMSNLRP